MFPVHSWYNKQEIMSVHHFTISGSAQQNIARVFFCVSNEKYGNLFHEEEEEEEVEENDSKIVKVKYFVRIFVRNLLNKYNN